ncbi:aminoglycoside phosphotransferase [Beutenbergia cavernae DSM 12333]|uniref:Aminoglycoside phosphotransferase n=1 Tax=Beutenbergia cavernae (strain ATCC BAA-8 / DSM 12333 / CCUG 43141 / JCM 11478 / NBRC 16432 / NCIMB 13614 / HKI 0122) TaxID=471853 RepID=C5BUX1_BEUC1|nr:aminoglycoside phosphotransferase family protein [Beutenbergia cavernae]ACQ78345.1 aminoglycoside phosphotransferase [Beutenbergia cavernae DSM 12333]
MSDDAEVPLSGGFANTVVKRGDTVRRNTGPWTPTVHALLRHLRSTGFDLVPEPLGIDDDGREILGFLPGDVAWWPWPPVLQRDEGIRAVASAVRQMQAALRTFDEPADAVWHGGPRTDARHQIRHGDLAPWNTLWVGDRLTGIIDWDTADPAPAGWDAAQGAWYFVPLRPLTGYRTAGPAPTIRERAHRLAVWCDELGEDPAHLLDVLDDVQRYERDRIRERGGAGEEPYATFLAKGAADDVEQERTWLAAHREELLAS